MRPTTLTTTPSRHPHLVYLEWIRGKFVCEGHWVKVKVTGAKKRQKSLLPQCFNTVGYSSRPHKAIPAYST